MQIDKKWFQFECWNIPPDKGFWIRIFGRGFTVRKGPLLFSERYNLKRYYRLPFGYRISRLRTIK
jgi:hypothetical protein